MKTKHFIRKFKSVNEATEAEGLKSPNISKVVGSSNPFGLVFTDIGKQKDVILKTNGNEVYGELDQRNVPLTFTVLQSGSTIQLISTGSPDAVSLEYSCDGTWWYTFQGGLFTPGVNMKLMLRAKSSNNAFSKDSSNYYAFQMTGKVAVSGNVMSLLDKDCKKRNIPDYCFYNLFNNCPAIVSAPLIYCANIGNCGCSYMFSNCTNLSEGAEINCESIGDLGCYNMFAFSSNMVSVPNINVKSIGSYGCYNMFAYCSSLKKAPELPATVVGNGGCYNMFNGCSNLQIAPAILPAMQIDKYCYMTMFSGCSSLGSAPTLPATTLADGCYIQMFAGCTSLVAAPNLPATELTESCYDSMFARCSSLTAAPNLPATELTQSCYSGMFSECSSLTTAPQIINASYAPKNSCSYMFSGCTSLQNAPIIKATQLGVSAYQSMFAYCTSLQIAPTLDATSLSEKSCYNMFKNCTSLVQSPALKSMTMADNCYECMFMNCSSIKIAPALPSTSLAYRCYYQMFENCTNLEQTPELPAKTVNNYNYCYMFNKCSKVTSLKVFADSISSYALSGWLNDTASGTTGLLYSKGKANLTSLIPSNWEIAPPDPLEVPLTFTATASSSSVAFNAYGTVPTVSLQYSTNGTTWSDYTIGQSISLSSVGAYVQFKAKGFNSQMSLGGDDYYKFTGSGTMTCTGNVMSLADENNFATNKTIPADYYFYQLFKENTCFTTSPLLPATTLTKWCYVNMFNGASKLTSVADIELPATSLPEYVYCSMFQNSALVNGPKIGAVTSSGSYAMASMFKNCYSLKSIEVHFTSWSGISSSWWFRSVGSSGTFKCYRALDTSSRSEATIPYGWTINYLD